jgi:hypothetical protein
MPRLRRYLPPLLLLLPLIFICGKLLLEPVERRKAFVLESPDCERGWPWVFQVLDVDLDGKFAAFQGLSKSPIDFALFAADVAVLLSIIGLTTLFMFWHRRRAGRWFRFSLRGLLLLTAVCAGLFGAWAKVAYDWRQEQQTLAEWEITQEWHDLKTYAGPDWLRRLAPAGQTQIFQRTTNIDVQWGVRPGINYATEFPRAVRRFRFLRRLSIHCPDEATTLHVADVDAFRQIESLSLNINTVDDDTLRWIGKLSRLKELDIQNFGDREHHKEVWNRGLAHLAGCQDLRKLTLGIPHVNEQGIEHLRSLSNLEYLEFFSECHVTAAMLASFSRLKTLDSLNFWGCQFEADGGLGDLKQIPNLREIDLRESNVTDKGIEALKQCPVLNSLGLLDCQRLTDRGLHQLLEYPCLHEVYLDWAATASDETWELLKQRIPSVKRVGISTVVSGSADESQ